MTTPDTITNAHETMRTLLTEMVKVEASDLHLVPGYRPIFRVHGRLIPTTWDAVEPDSVSAMINSVIPAAKASQFEQSTNMDFSVSIPATEPGEHFRYRANAFRTGGNVCGCFRFIPQMVPTFEWMGFPQHIARNIGDLTNGLVIVTGVTGSGKSTTLAAVMNLFNERGGYRIITAEDPIEYQYERTDHTIITQREVGVDCDSFFDGLKYGLRQDPDVILVGEIRDRETARMALSAAETGHLILTTMHTKDAKGAISRFVDLFEHSAQDDIRVQLSYNLRMVIAQHLLPDVDPTRRRALALETMIVNNPVRAGIRLGKLEAIESAIQTGRADGMIRLDDSLQGLLSTGRISKETARRFAKNPDMFV
ncbi:MAG: PilT/PilU family type 4a pilus ATPase [Planctomycetes bacterium]|nr:PilT/PilU family type 4a pilus ATPase [Planctomycetota bacterium]